MDDVELLMTAEHLGSKGLPSAVTKQAQEKKVCALDWSVEFLMWKCLNSSEKVICLVVCI